ncbi:hypothetical protein MKW98_015751 [Papaver atlanticum]|uniref:Uncharacterized protein n=1 Tax=Papaver atlanticum TaxID=357466 RepID=A0AAD4SX99_9MAGN|nr:hypothetical protein MKW98_015751 [Papaver atlanticum]
MDESLTNSKLVMTALNNGISLSINWFTRYTPIMEHLYTNIFVARGELTPWVPNLVTSYYTPESPADHTDVTELRNTLLNKKINYHSNDTNNKVL